MDLGLASVRLDNGGGGGGANPADSTLWKNYFGMGWNTTNIASNVLGFQTDRSTEKVVWGIYSGPLGDLWIGYFSGSIPTDPNNYSIYTTQADFTAGGGLSIKDGLTVTNGSVNVQYGNLTMTGGGIVVPSGYSLSGAGDIDITGTLTSGAATFNGTTEVAPTGTATSSKNYQSNYLDIYSSIYSLGAPTLYGWRIYTDEVNGWLHFFNVQASVTTTLTDSSLTLSTGSNTGGGALSCGAIYGPTAGYLYIYANTKALLTLAYDVAGAERYIQATYGFQFLNAATTPNGYANGYSAILDMTAIDTASPYMDQNGNLWYPNATAGDSWNIYGSDSKTAFSVLVDGTKIVNITGTLNFQGTSSTTAPTAGSVAIPDAVGFVNIEISGTSYSLPYLNPVA